MPDVEFGCLPTIIGSMPHTDPDAACGLISYVLKDLPAWPQLPKRSYLENVYAQFSQGFPGVEIEGESITVNCSQDLDPDIEKLYAAYIENNIEQFPIERAYAAGLHTFLTLPGLAPRAVKGQVIGPVSFGLTLCDNNKKPILYDDVYSDLASKLLRLKAAWQERVLKQVSRNTIIFVDEPSMSVYGSAYYSFSKEKVITLLEDVLAGIEGLKGIHCCGNTDWSVILATSADIVSYDAYNYAESLSLYPDEIKRLLDRSGAIAWGIVPNDEASLSRESVSSLKDRLEEAMAPFTRKGIRFRDLVVQGLITPSCGLAPLSEAATSTALVLLTELSARMRKAYL